MRKVKYMMNLDHFTMQKAKYSKMLGLHKRETSKLEMAPTSQI